ncbi:ureidoglycolate lyase [Rhodovibrionaceae bacterium A322]
MTTMSNAPGKSPISKSHASFPQSDLQDLDSIKDLTRVSIPVVEATEESLQGFGQIVTDPYQHPIEIVPWPLSGWRKMDPGCGDEGGTTEGIFSFSWDDEGVLRGHNEAVNDQYVLARGLGQGNRDAGAGFTAFEEMAIRHANYHPDGGQLFFPQEEGGFLTPLALPGDNVTPQDFICFYVPSGKGVYINPGIWHEAVFPLRKDARFFDKQGKVHARVSCNFDEEFGALVTFKTSPTQSL